MVQVPEFSEYPVSHLNEDLYYGFSLGQYDLLGEQILSDHIGYGVESLASFSGLNLRLGLGPGSQAEYGDWAATLLFVDPGK